MFASEAWILSPPSGSENKFNLPSLTQKMSTPFPLPNIFQPIPPPCQY